jgi:hypothetical protein
MFVREHLLWHLTKNEVIQGFCETVREMLGFPNLVLEIGNCYRMSLFTKTIDHMVTHHLGTEFLGKNLKT